MWNGVQGRGTLSAIKKHEIGKQIELTALLPPDGSCPLLAGAFLPGERIFATGATFLEILDAEEAWSWSADVFLTGDFDLVIGGMIREEGGLRVDGKKRKDS